MDRLFDIPDLVAAPSESITPRQIDGLRRAIELVRERPPLPFPIVPGLTILDPSKLRRIPYGELRRIRRRIILTSFVIYSTRLPS